MNWIRRGLRFECQPECGRCCTNEREGSVFVEPHDIETLAAHLGITARSFASRFTTRDSEDEELELARDGEGACVFLDESRCGVYEARPLQCRTYPFFPLDGFTPIESAYTWRHEKKYCPGIGKGRLFSKREIADVARGRAGVSGFDV